MVTVVMFVLPTGLICCTFDSEVSQVAVAFPEERTHVLAVWLTMAPATLTPLENVCPLAKVTRSR